MSQNRNGSPPPDPTAGGNVINWILRLHDKLTFRGVGLLLIGGFGAVFLWQLYSQAEKWFPRFVDSPFGVAGVVVCALIFIYAVVQDKLVGRVDQRTDQLQAHMNEAISVLRAEVATARNEASEARAAERACMERYTICMERYSQIIAMLQQQGRSAP